MISEKFLQDFIALYKQEFGETLDRQEALKQATSLITLVKLTYQPMTKENWEKCSKHLDNPDSEPICRQVSLTGTYYWFKGNQDTAIIFYRKARIYSKSNNLEDQLTNSLSNLVLHEPISLT